jgi:hypothetical protein
MFHHQDRKWECCVRLFLSCPNRMQWQQQWAHWWYEQPTKKQSVSTIKCSVKRETKQNDVGKRKSWEWERDEKELQKTYLQSSDCSCIFRRLTLSVIEIGRTCDDSIFHWLTQERFSNFFHFQEDHRRDFFRSKVFGFFFVLNADVGFVSFFANNFEWPVFHISLHCRVW